jgi:hypothetical protein
MGLPLWEGCLRCWRLVVVSLATAPPKPRRLCFLANSNGFLSTSLLTSSTASVILPILTEQRTLCQQRPAAGHPQFSAPSTIPSSSAFWYLTFVYSLWTTPQASDKPYDDSWITLALDQFLKVCHPLKVIWTLRYVVPSLPISLNLVVVPQRRA